MKVFVISTNGERLMPCTCAKAKKLLKSKRAKVIKLYPFTIQLEFDCEDIVQPITLGLDSGFGNIGFSCVTEKEELISGTVILDGKTSERLTERAMYRRNRRFKLRYRKPRFLNRKRKEGWLPPSVQRRYDTHLKIINLLKSVMPITKTIIEVGNFDIQKLNNPDISGIDYQQGDMYEYQNMRSFLMSREKGKCQICGKEFTKTDSSHIHHIIERANGGSDRAKNLAILHKSCHNNLHKKKLKLKPNKTYKDATFMNTIKNKFWNDVSDLEVTYGYKTFTSRINLGLEKTHFTDAFVIAEGTNQKRVKTIEIKQKRRNNRSLQLNRIGFAPSIRKKRYTIQPKDLVWIEGKKYVVKGSQNKGTVIAIFGYKKSTIGLKKIEKVYHFGSFCFN